MSSLLWQTDLVQWSTFPLKSNCLPFPANTSLLLLEIPSSLLRHKVVEFQPTERPLDFSQRTMERSLNGMHVVSVGNIVGLRTESVNLDLANGLGKSTKCEVVGRACWLRPNVCLCSSLHKRSQDQGITNSGSLVTRLFSIFVGRAVADDIFAWIFRDQVMNELRGLGDSSIPSGCDSICNP